MQPPNGQGGTMSAIKDHGHKPATRIGALPQTPETLHRPVLKGVKGDKRQVVLNGSRVYMQHDGKQWWNVKVEAA
jgi:hypothetical protein